MIINDNQTNAEFVGYCLSIDSFVFLESIEEEKMKGKYGKITELKFVIDGNVTNITLNRLKEILKQA